RPKTEKITILDLGCGDGELLRQCAYFGKKNNLNIELIGLDFNENILQLAEIKSSEFSNINFQKVDVFSEENLIPNCDIALCTLFLHHCSDERIDSFLKMLIEKTHIGLIINDLHRSRAAFNLFKVIIQLFLQADTARHDGLVSIAKGFKKQELESFSKRII